MLAVQNADPDQLKVSRIDVDGSAAAAYTAPFYLSGGEKKLVAIPLSSSCSTGQPYTYSIAFTYAKTSGSTEARGEYGQMKLLGVCNQ